VIDNNDRTIIDSNDGVTLDNKDNITIFAYYHIYVITCISNDNINRDSGYNADDSKN